jgi:ribose 5-phosphate isomerase B
MRIVIGSDHLGLSLKNHINNYLKEKGFEITDFGTHTPEPVDYPDIARVVAKAVARGEFDRGILICGTGIGMAIAANKVRGIRAATCHDPYSAERARKSNNAQIMTLGSQVIGQSLAELLVDIWMQAEFQGGKSAIKVEKINQIEQDELKNFW